MGKLTTKAYKQKPLELNTKAYKLKLTMVNLLMTSILSWSTDTRALNVEEFRYLVSGKTAPFSLK
jgi:hypothetical protein